jgi:hypothetical protein
MNSKKESFLVIKAPSRYHQIGRFGRPRISVLICLHGGRAESSCWDDNSQGRTRDLAGVDRRRQKKETIGMASRVIIVLQNFVVEEEYLVMAGVMDELRLDFGSPDVLFVSISSWDVPSVVETQPRFTLCWDINTFCSIRRAILQACQS